MEHGLKDAVYVQKHVATWAICFNPQGLALLTLSWDKKWDSHSLVNGYPSFYPRIALVAPSSASLRHAARVVCETINAVLDDDAIWSN